MLPDRVSNPGPLTYESGALPIALRGPANENLIPQISSLVTVYRAVSQTEGERNEKLLAREKYPNNTHSHLLQHSRPLSNFYPNLFSRKPRHFKLPKPITRPPDHNHSTPRLNKLGREHLRVTPWLSNTVELQWL